MTGKGGTERAMQSKKSTADVLRGTAKVARQGAQQSLSCLLHRCKGPADQCPVVDRAGDTKKPTSGTCTGKQYNSTHPSTYIHHELPNILDSTVLGSGMSAVNKADVVCAPAESYAARR